MNSICYGGNDGVLWDVRGGRKKGTEELMLHSDPESLESNDLLLIRELTIRIMIYRIPTKPNQLFSHMLSFLVR